MRIPNEAILFIRTYGGAHKYFLPVAENNKGVCDHIHGMGVSTVVEPRWRAARAVGSREEATPRRGARRST